ncbi:MAG: lysine exporter LysO family protein [Muribaculaceae bacterium]
MFTILAFLISGMALGILLRRGGVKSSLLGKLMPIVSRGIMALIYLLLFLFGIRLGADREVVSNLSTLGWQSLLLCVAAMAGSIFFTLITERILRKVRAGKN